MVLSDDARELADVLDVVAESVPELLRSLIDLLYSPQAGARLGEATGGFYRKLVDSGLPAPQALELTRDYLAPLRSLRDLVHHR